MEDKGKIKRKFGYTTGTYSAAAVKGALKSLLEGAEPCIEIEVTLPDSKKALIPIRHTKITPSPSHSYIGGWVKEGKRSVTCGVVKKSIEETDVTHNIEIFACVSFRDDDRIVIKGGIGIGQVTKIGLQVPVGEAAINPVPKKMILQSIREQTARGVDVLISAPRGEEIAASTTNARLGIIGGISIIGTTGIMYPKSLNSFKKTILQQLDFCKKNEINEIVITPGNISEKGVLTHFGYKVKENQVIQSGDFLGFTLKYACKRGLSFLLAGHPGKLAKVLAGHFQTHYTNSPPANQMVLEFLKGKIKDDLIQEMRESPTVEGITTILREHNKGKLLNSIAAIIEDKVCSYLKVNFPIPVLLFNMNSKLIGFSKSGAEWTKR